MGEWVPLIIKLPSDDGSRTGGEPLPALFDIWLTGPGLRRTPGYLKKVRHVKRLCATLPAHPTPAEVAQLFALLDRRVGSGTAYLYRCILSRIFTYACAVRACQGHPVQVLKDAGLWAQPERPQIEPVANMRGEVWPAVLFAFKNWRMALCYLAALRFLGIRCEEGCALTPPDVIQRPDAWRVAVRWQRSHPNSFDRRPTKGKRSRVLPVSAELRPFLAEALEFQRRAFRTGRGGLGPKVVPPFLFPFRERDPEGGLCELRARLRAAHPAFAEAAHPLHRFRHIRAREIGEAKKPLRTVRDVLGHKSVQTTDSYMGRLIGEEVDADVFDFDDEKKGGKQ